MKPQVNPSISPLAVRADDAAKMLCICRTSLHYLMKSGKIPYTKINRIVLFRVKDLDDFLHASSNIKKRRIR